MMIRRSIKRKIIGIALILIALMTITALISLALVMQVSGRLQELTQSYAPAYAALAKTAAAAYIRDRRQRFTADVWHK